MNVRFEGYNENMLTFECGDDVKVGSLVRISDNRTVSECVADEDFCGICRAVRDGYAAVQLSGYAEVAYSGSMNVGRVMLSASDGTAVKIDTTVGTSRLVLTVDTVNQTAGIIL